MSTMNTPPLQKNSANANNKNTTAAVSPDDEKVMTLDNIRLLMKDQQEDLIGLPERTKTHTFQGWSSLWFRNYEHAAACKSAFNKQFINVKLGITPSAKKYSRPAGSNNKKRKVSPPAREPRRTSRRIAKEKAPEPLPLPEDGAPKIKKTPTNNKVRKSVKAYTFIAKLSDKQMEKLSKFCSGSWMEQFESYLDDVEQISVANKRNVMRQVGVLVNGQPMFYKHWKRGVFFNSKRIKIHLGMDLVQVLDDAEEFEMTHGRDLGNGTFCRVIFCAG